MYTSHAPSAQVRFSPAMCPSNRPNALYQELQFQLRHPPTRFDSLGYLSHLPRGHPKNHDDFAPKVQKFDVKQGPIPKMVNEFEQLRTTDRQQQQFRTQGPYNGQANLQYPSEQPCRCQFTRVEYPEPSGAIYRGPQQTCGPDIDQISIIAPQDSSSEFSVSQPSTPGSSRSSEIFSYVKGGRKLEDSCGQSNVGGAGLNPMTPPQHCADFQHGDSVSDASIEFSEASIDFGLHNPSALDQSFGSIRSEYCYSLAQYEYSPSADVSSLAPSSQVSLTYQGELSPGLHRNHDLTPEGQNSADSQASQYENVTSAAPLHPCGQVQAQSGHLTSPGYLPPSSSLNPILVQPPQFIYQEIQTQNGVFHTFPPDRRHQIHHTGTLQPTYSSGTGQLSKSAKNGLGFQKKSRIQLTKTQKTKLEELFKRNNYVDLSNIDRIATNLQMKTVQIKAWFQNKRYYQKKKAKRQM